MKCPSCGGQLIQKGDTFLCQYCDSSFLKEEVIKKNEQNYNNFVIENNIVTKYVGRDQTIIIPEGIISIGPRAFINNLVVKKVIFCSSLVSIEKEAFQGCLNLIEIKDYQDINQFGDGCFQSTGIKELEINENVTSIGKNAFSDISNLIKLNYHPGKNLHLDKTFARCANLSEVLMDQHYFFPFLCRGIEVRNNPGNKRPTYADAFQGTKYYQIIKNELNDSYKRGVCPDCGGQIKKGLFHAKCVTCGIDYKAISF